MRLLESYRLNFGKVKIYFNLNREGRMDIDIERQPHKRIRVTDLDDGGYIESQTVESNILFAILEKLEEIRCGIINVENELK